MRWPFSNFGWVGCVKFVFFWEILLWDYGFVLNFDGFVMWEGAMIVNLVDFVVGGIKRSGNPANPDRMGGFAGF